MAKLADVALSIALQHMAESLDNEITRILGGERAAFVLLVAGPSALQYVSNGDRQEMLAIFKEMVARIESNKADIPAHYNPDLKE